jgi:purine-binding chemotaxis protein CheW
MGIIVDRVSDIFSFAKEDIQYLDNEFADDIKVEHVMGMAKTEDQIVLILNPERILSFKELEQIEEMVEDEEESKEKND